MAEPLINGAAPASNLLLDQFGRVVPPKNDPAWQPAHDPLTGSPPLAERAGIIYREVPISYVATSWTVDAARSAKNDLVLGTFNQPAQMVDAIIFTDSRVRSGLASRLSILGRPVEFRIPRKYRDSALAQECLDAFEDSWPEMAPESAIGEMQRWAIMMGFGPAQILWDTTGDYAVPHPQPWNPRYTYYHWLLRCYVALTLDGQTPIIPGDGNWMLHAPDGDYRGWMRGAVGAITPWWLGRSYALRDWMRYSERHGLPMIKLKTPAVGDPAQQSVIRFQVENIGQEAVFHLPQNPPPALSYDIELMEAKDTAHEGFRMLIEQCNSEITLALLAQTLTTSMPAEGGSSYAAARVHAGVLQGLLEADARTLARTMYRQLARPFAAMNFGNPDLAPRVVWDVTPFEDAKTKALAFMQLAEAVNFLRVGGFKLNTRDLRKMIRDTIPGFDVGRIDAVDPIAVAGINAKAKADQKSASQEAKQDATGARARVAANIAGARFDPRALDKVRVRLDAEADDTREALAEMEAAHAERSHVRRYIP